MAKKKREVELDENGEEIKKETKKKVELTASAKKLFDAALVYVETHPDTGIPSYYLGVRNMFIKGANGTIAVTPKPGPDMHKQHKLDKLVESGNLDALAAKEEFEKQKEFEEEMTKPTTAFLVDPVDKQPILSNHMLKGVFKERCKNLRIVTESMSSRLTSYMSIIGCNFNIKPRFLKLYMPEGKTMEECVRSLRAETAQGPRVCLATSEKLPDFTTFDFVVKFTIKEHLSLILEWLNLCKDVGVGQWRTAGYGTLVYKIIPISKVRGYVGDYDTQEVKDAVTAFQTSAV